MEAYKNNVFVGLILISFISVYGADIIQAKDSITISCTNNDTLDTVSPLPAVTTPRKIVIENCPVPSGSYTPQLNRINLNMTPEMTILFLKSSNLSSELRAANFLGLKIRTLAISQYYIREDILEPLKTLQIYNVAYSSVPMLSNNHRLRHMALSNGNFTGEWGYCGAITIIILKQWTVDKTTNAWLRNCSKLTDLRLQDFDYESLENILIGLTAITSLSLKNCFLKNNKWDGELVKEAKYVTHLNLSHTGIIYLTNKSFVHHKNLSVVDLSYNRIEFVTYKSATPFVPDFQPMTLKSLVLDGNTKFQDICTSSAKSIWVIVVMASLNNIGFTKLCFGNWDYLYTLSLRQNNIKTLEFNELPLLTKFGVLNIDLQNNPITIPSYSKEEYDVIMKRYGKVKNLTILLDPIKLDCDCQHGWLARAMTTKGLYLDKIRCSTGELLTEVSPKRLECEKYQNGSYCVVRKSWDNGTVAAECEGAELSSVPRLKNVTRFNLRYNLIDDLQPGDFDDHLQFADLRNNLISNISADTVAAMFAFKNRSFLLAGNPILCTCDGLPLIAALQNYSMQVEDYHDTSCADGSLVKYININTLCLDDLLTVPIWVNLTLAALGIILITVFLVYRFSHKISLLFYTKGWCLFCFDESDVYEERDYDAFLSFCHLDDDFIAENILPELGDYKLCIHYRDWMAGEWIPGQIAKSIARSHRTLMFLSKNFLASSWGMLEFRMALAAITKDDCRRLVAIVLDDVIEEEQLDAELRSYLSNNTYVKWGDPWFFKKLRLILPEREVTEIVEMSETTTVSGVQVQQPLIAEVDDCNDR